MKLRNRNILPTVEEKTKETNIPEVKKIEKEAQSNGTTSSFTTSLKEAGSDRDAKEKVENPEKNQDSTQNGVKLKKNARKRQEKAMLVSLVFNQDVAPILSPKKYEDYPPPENQSERIEAGRIIEAIRLFTETAKNLSETKNTSRSPNLLQIIEKFGDDENKKAVCERELDVLFWEIFTNVTPKTKTLNVHKNATNAEGKVIDKDDLERLKKIIVEINQLSPIKSNENQGDTNQTQILPSETNKKSPTTNIKESDAFFNLNSKEALGYQNACWQLAKINRKNAENNQILSTYDLSKQSMKSFKEEKREATIKLFRHLLADH